MGQREQLKEKLYALKIEGKNCIDWGSGAKPAAKYVSHKDCSWVCLDKNPDIVDMYRELGLEYVVCDIEKRQHPGEYSVAFCLEVLEHTIDYDQVIENIYNSLIKDGVLYLSVPFLYPIHADEDYWRFTKHGLALVLKRFRQVDITSFDNDTGYWVEAIK